MKNNLIFSRNANNTALCDADIAHRAPSVFSSTIAEHLSDKYRQLRTADLLPVLADYGYFPTQASQKRTNKNKSPDHAAHMLAFSKATDIDEGADGLRPEIILYNSHDGSSAVKLYAGAYRFICSNGIVAGDGLASSVYHSNKAMAGFEETLRHTIDTMPTLMAKIEKMRSVTITDKDRLYAMAKLSVMTRWNWLNNEESRAGTYANDMTLSRAVSVNRNEDNYQDAWTVFNRIQESVIRGNTMIVSIDKDGIYRQRKPRPIASVQEYTRINSQLFSIAELVSA